MKTSDTGRRVRIFDRPPGCGSGLLGILLEVYDDTSFRFLSDSGKETEYMGFKGTVEYLDKDVQS